jgi:phosphatidylglycerophosphate synthase
MQIFQKKYIPNYLTFFRVLATVGVVILLLLPFGKVIYSFSVAQQNYEFTLNYFLAGIIFLAGVLSDFLDGYLARKFN